LLSKTRVTAVVLFVCSWFLFTGLFETVTGLNKKGGKLYEEKRYESALEAYRAAQIRDPNQPRIRYNLGTSLYQIDQFQEAETELKNALERSETNDLKGRAWYNYGNTQYRLGRFDQAIEAYKKTLDIDPDDEDAKFNLEVLQKKKDAFEEQQQQRDQQKEQEQSQQQQQQQDQQSSGGGGQQDEQESESQGSEQPEQGQGDQEQEQQGQQDQDESSQDDPSQQEGEGQEDQSEQVQGQQRQAQPGDEQENQNQQQQQQGEQQEQQQQPQAPGRLLQGQMAQEDAMRILDALRQTEQQLQTLRRPTEPEREHQPLRDW
jgi:Ca-activated chloride channel homolog